MRIQLSTGTKLILSFAALVLTVAVLVFTLNKNLRWSAGYLLSGEVPAPASPMQRLPPCPGCNLILISLDTLRADRMGYLGSSKGLTPNLDRIAARSVVFENAFTNAWFTTPSHMTVFTSLYPQTHRMESERIRMNVYEVTKTKARPLNKRYKTLAEILHANGYATFWRAPLHLKYFDFEDGFARGFDSKEPPPFDRVPEFSSHRAFDTKALAPVTSHPAKPVFMFLHSYMTHLPYFSDELDSGEDSHVSYSRRVLGELTHILQDSPRFLVNESDQDLDKVSEKRIAEISKLCDDFWDLRACFKTEIGRDAYWHAVGLAQAIRAMRVIRMGNPQVDSRAGELAIYRESYDHAVKALDAQIGDMWKALEASGALKNTMVVFISDHGEELFEHNSANHSSFYDHTERVPVMVFHPKMDKPMRVNQLFSLIDVMPMALEILGVHGPAQMQGHLPWAGVPKFVFGYTLGTDVIRSTTWKLLRRYSGSEELFYLPNDPGEHHDLMALDNRWVKKAYMDLVVARKNWEAEQSL